MLTRPNGSSLGVMTASSSLATEKIDGNSPAKGRSCEWYTPEWVLLLVLAMLGRIDLDPCSNPQKTVPALRHYVGDQGHDGTVLPWGELREGVGTDGELGTFWIHPFTVFANPPWQDLLPWVIHLLAEYQARHFTECLLLVPARIGRPWFQLLNAFPLWLPDQRIQYLKRLPDGTLKQSNQVAEFSVMFYIGPSARFAKFEQIFSPKGHVRPPATPVRADLTVATAADSYADRRRLLSQQTPDSQDRSEKTA